MLILGFELVGETVAFVVPPLVISAAVEERLVIVLVPLKREAAEPSPVASFELMDEGKKEGDVDEGNNRRHNFNSSASVLSTCSKDDNSPGGMRYSKREIGEGGYHYFVLSLYPIPRYSFPQVNVSIPVRMGISPAFLNWFFFNDCSCNSLIICLVIPNTVLGFFPGIYKVVTNRFLISLFLFR